MDNTEGTSASRNPDCSKRGADNGIAVIGDKAIDEVISWLLAYHPYPVTRTVCNRMRYFAVLAYEVVDDILKAVGDGSPGEIDIARARFFTRVKEIVGTTSDSKE